jgi:hypothetical protein
MRKIKRASGEENIFVSFFSVLPNGVHLQTFLRTTAHHQLVRRSAGILIIELTPVILMVALNSSNVK